eukprot:251671-Hanusia_phi.AAC.1
MSLRPLRPPHHLPLEAHGPPHVAQHKRKGRTSPAAFKHFAVECNEQLLIIDHEIALGPCHGCVCLPAGIFCGGSLGSV